MFRRVDRNDTTAAQRVKATLVNVKYEVNNDGAGDYQRDDEGGQLIESCHVEKRRHLPTSHLAIVPDPPVSITYILR